MLQTITHYQKCPLGRSLQMEEIPATKPAQRNDLALKLLGPLPPSLSLSRSFPSCGGQKSKVAPRFTTPRQRRFRFKRRRRRQRPLCASRPATTCLASLPYPKQRFLPLPSVRPSDGRRGKGNAARGQCTDDGPRTVERPPSVRPSVCGDITTYSETRKCEVTCDISTEIDWLKGVAVC